MNQHNISILQSHGILIMNYAINIVLVNKRFEPFGIPLVYSVEKYTRIHNHTFHKGNISSGNPNRPTTTSLSPLSPMADPKFWID